MLEQLEEIERDDARKLANLTLAIHAAVHKDGRGIVEFVAALQDRK